jgi:hypothetical protein
VVAATEERQVVWETLAQYWVDTWYDDEQLDRFADQLAACGFSLRELDRIASREVCGAFATFTLAAFLSFGMALPDFFFPEEEARRKVSSWLARPLLFSLLNPFWLIGYLAARGYLRASWADLRRRVARRLDSADGSRGWEVAAPSDPGAFFLALPELLPPAAVLVLEERGMAAEIRAAIEPHRTTPSLRVSRQTLFPRSHQHHLRLTPELARLLGSAAGDVAAPEICDHVSAYRDGEVLLEWHDAFSDDPILLSAHLDETAVRRFAERLGVGFARSER